MLATAYVNVITFLINDILNCDQSLTFLKWKKKSSSFIFKKFCYKNYWTAFAWRSPHLVNIRRPGREQQRHTARLNPCSPASGFIMLTGAWLSPKHNSWWSEKPEVEPQGVRWPAHSFTSSSHRGQETAGFLGAGDEAGFFSDSSTLQEPKNKAGAKKHYNDRCFIGHMQKSKCLKRCKHWTQAC